MSAILPNYGYDIFISYRHNDNLPTGQAGLDGWVTAFVQNLEKELRGTLKDTLTIYFDKNPHDGLLETHNVDKSLEGKLKCLIFIPIISQTYCDIKGFAWQHEFVAFNKLAKENPFGRDIKLSNGNVASRILPVKIHDLDAEDQAIIEGEIGGELRAIEFSFKSPGVNRSLCASEQHAQDNQNKTFYRDQINKVANAVKELILSLKGVKRKPGIHSERDFHHAEAKSIAVLPLVNMSGDPNEEYFSDGITEEILNYLARIKGLKVTGRTSSFQFKNKNPDLREVGNRLGVQFVLEGSIRRQGDKVRITVQLISANDGFHVWSERYDRKLHDIFALQDEIAAEITKKLKLSLLEDNLTGASRTDMMSYEYYLLGRYNLNLRSGDGVQKAIEYFKKALATDNAFALSYSGLADAYILAAIGYAPIPDAFQLAKDASESSLALNPNLSEPYVSSGYWHLNNGNWAIAQKSFERALEINPNNARAYQWLAQYHLYVSEYEQAMVIANKAKEIEPLSPLIVTESGWPYYYLKRYHEAIEIYRHALTLDSQFMMAHYNLGNGLENLGELEQATKEYAKAVELSNRSPFTLSFYASCLIRTGRLDEGKAILNEMLDVAKRGVSIGLWIAWVYESMGHKEETIRWLESAIESKEPMLIALHTVWFPFKGLRGDSKYLSILDRLSPQIRSVVLSHLHMV